MIFVLVIISVVVSVLHAWFDFVSALFVLIFVVVLSVLIFVSFFFVGVYVCVGINRVKLPILLVVS